MNGLARRATAEACGTAMLLVAVVGSGIMAERLSGGNVALALLANALATGGALVALILAFGPVSGAHLNPAVTLADASQGGLPWSEVPGYVLAQCLGALAGVAQVALTLYTRLQIFTSLPLEQLDRLKLETLTRNIGRDQFPQKDSAA